VEVVEALNPHCVLEQQTGARCPQRCSVRS